MSDKQSKWGLIIIDLQNDFLHANGAYSRGKATSAEALLLADRVVPVAKAVKQHGGMVAASLFTLWPDTHGDPMISPHLFANRPFLKKGDFKMGGWGHANLDAIASHADVTVNKVAYSAFFNTQLDWFLRRAGITHLAVCGIVTNGGVASTVRDAHMRDYHTVVISDGCAAFSQKIHDAAIADMSTVATVMDCKTFIQQLG